MSFEVSKKIIDLTSNAAQNMQNKDFSIAFGLLKEAENLVSPVYIPRRLKIQTYFGLARYHQIVGHLRKALKYLEKVLEITHDKVALGKSHLNIAFVYSAQGLHQKSLFHSFKTLEFLSNSEEHEGIASAYHNLGIEYQYLKQNARAILAFKKGFRISKKYLGDSHELTRVLRACYFESQKATTILTTKPHNFSQSDHQEITHIINELEKSPLKSLTPIPNNNKKKKISLVPLKTACLIKSIQYGNLQNLNKTQPKFLSKSPIIKRKSNSIHKHGRSLDPRQELIPIPSKTKIVISGRHFFTIENKGKNKFSDVIGRRKSKEIRGVNKSKQIIRSVVKIQKIWRMMREKSRFLKMKKNAVKIQAVFRGYRDRKFCQFLNKS